MQASSSSKAWLQAPARGVLWSWSKWGKKLTRGQLSQLVLIGAPVISATTAEIIWPGQVVTMTTSNTPWLVVAAAARGKVLLAGQPAPTLRKVKHSSPSLRHLLLTRTQNEARTSQTAVRLLVWRTPVAALRSAWAKEMEDCCPQKCCPIIGLIWLQGVGWEFQVPFFCIATWPFKAVGSPCYFQNFAWFSNELVSSTIRSSFEQFGPTNFILAHWKSKMLLLHLFNSLPVIKNSESFTEFKRSSDIHQQSCGIWPKERAPEQSGWKVDPVMQSAVRLAVSLGPGCASSEQTFQAEEQQKLMRNDTKLV